MTKTSYLHFCVGFKAVNFFVTGIFCFVVISKRSSIRSKWAISPSWHFSTLYFMFTKFEKKIPFCHHFGEKINSSKMSCFEIVTFLQPLFWVIVTFDPRENKSWPWDNLSLKWMRGKWILKNKYIHTKSVSNHYSYSQGIKSAALTILKISAWNILTHGKWAIK